MTRRTLGGGRILVGLVSALAALWITPAVSSETPIGRIEVAFRPGPGRTHLELPPVGTVTADTHSAPLGLHIQVQRIELEKLGELGDDIGGREDAVTAARGDLIRSIALQGLLTMLIASLIAAALSMTFYPARRRNAWRTPVTAAVGALTTLGLASGALYRETAFEQPVFHGPIQAAPEVLRKLDSALDGAGQVSSRIDTITSHLAALSAPLPSDGEDTTAILHVSDIHSNPVAILWINGLKERFDIDVVIDTGDITSFGYSPEAATIENPLEVGREDYWIVYGNHDADSVRSRLNDRLTPLHLTIRELAGLRVGGIDDPTFTPQEKVTNEETARQYREAARELATFCKDQRPDIVAVHNPEQAAAVDGCADIVLTGHLHESDQYRLPGGTRVLVAGTTGAGGVEGLSPDGQYVAQILRFQGRTLLSIDVISVSPETGEFTTARINPDAITYRS